MNRLENKIDETDFLGPRYSVSCLGPFLLARRTAESGRSAWSLVPASDGGEQLALDEGSGG